MFVYIYIYIYRERERYINIHNIHLQTYTTTFPGGTR